MFNITASGEIYETLLGWRAHCKCCLFKILTGKWTWSNFNLSLFWQVSVNLSLNSQSLSRQSSSLWTVSPRKELVDNMFILLLQYYKNIWSQWQQRKISGWQTLTMYLCHVYCRRALNFKKLTKTLHPGMDVKFLFFILHVFLLPVLIL